MLQESRIFVAGHRGLVGSAILRRLKTAGAQNVLTATRELLDLRDQAAVSYWFKANRPEYVYLVAGTVGGIMANSTRPAEFIYDNMMIHAMTAHSCARSIVERVRRDFTDLRLCRCGWLGRSVTPSIHAERLVRSTTVCGVR